MRYIRPGDYNFDADGPRRFRCGKGHAALVLGGGAFANAGGGGASGVGAARTRLDTAAKSFAALPSADQEQQVMDWSKGVKGEPPPRNYYEAQAMLNARNTHDMLTYTQAMAVVGKRKLKGLGVAAATADSKINGELDNRLKKLTDHPVSNMGEALELRRMLDEVRSGETAHCRHCGRFVSGKVDTPDCPHCTGGECPVCAGRNHAAVKLAKLRAVTPAAVTTLSPPAGEEKAPPSHYPFARPAGTPLTEEDIEAMQDDDDEAEGSSSVLTKGASPEAAMVASGSASAAAPAASLPPSTPSIALTAAPPPPAGPVEIGYKDVTAHMFAGEKDGADWEMPDGSRVPHGKQITPKNAAEYGISLPAVLARVVTPGVRITGGIKVSDDYFDAALASQGRVEQGDGIVRVTFDAAGSEHQAYAKVDVSDGSVHTYCDDGRNYCPHQLVALAHALAGKDGAKALAQDFYEQIQAAPPPVGAAQYGTISAQEMLRRQDALYRSLLHIGERGGSLMFADGAVEAEFKAGRLGVGRPPVAAEDEIEGAVGEQSVPLNAEEAPQRPKVYSPPPELSAEQQKLAVIVGYGLPGNRLPGDYSPEMQALIPRPQDGHDYVLGESHEEAALMLSERLQQVDPGAYSTGLYGVAGTGKNRWAKEVARALGRPYFEVDCSNGTSGEDLTGAEKLEVRQVVNPDGSTTMASETVFRLGPVAEIARQGGVVCINETASMDPSGLTKIHMMIADRRIAVDTVSGQVGFIPVHHDTVIVLTWNPNQSATQQGVKLADALRSRVKPIEMRPPTEADLTRQLSSSVSATRGYEVKESDPVVAASAKLFTRLSVLHNERGLESEVSPRDISGVVNWLVHRRESRGGTLTDLDHKLALKQLASLCAQSPGLVDDQKRDLAAAYYNLYNKLGLSRQLGPTEF